MSNFQNSFNNEKTFNASQYEEFKKYAEEVQPVMKQLPLGSLSIINSKQVKITIVEDGQLKTSIFTLSADGLKSLLKMFNLNITTYDSLSGAMGEKAMQIIIEQLQNKMTSEAKTKTVIVSISKKTKEVISVIKSRDEDTLMDNTKYFRLVEEALSGFESSGMKIKNLTVSSEGNLAITIVNKNWTFDVEGIKSGLKDEYFNTGMTLIKTPNKLVINPFNERLVCTNGMISTENTHSLVLNSTRKEDIDVFFEKAKNFGKGRNAFESDFKNRIITMLGTNASFNEVLGCYNAVNYTLNSGHERSKILLNSMFNVHDINGQFVKQTGINLFDQDNKYKSKVITEYNMWELVNLMTDLSSNTHKHEFEFSNLNTTVFELQKYAGGITFKKEYDLGNSIPQIFEANAAMTNADIIAKLRNANR